MDTYEHQLYGEQPGLAAEPPGLQAIRECVSQARCPEVTHHTVASKKPSDFAANVFINCPERINLPSSATGWTGLPYTPFVNSHEAYCWPGGCLLSCMHTNGGSLFEVYQERSGGVCYPEITGLGTRFFECL
jgi:hypothetical protein